MCVCVLVCYVLNTFTPLPTLQLLETWALLVSLTQPSDEGFGLDTLKRTEIVGKSFMAQFEALASERSPAHLKDGCVISYAKILLLGHGACGYFDQNTHIYSHTRIHTNTRAHIHTRTHAPTHKHTRTHNIPMVCYTHI